MKLKLEENHYSPIKSSRRRVIQLLAALGGLVLAPDLRIKRLWALDKIEGDEIMARVKKNSSDAVAKEAKPKAKPSKTKLAANAGGDSLYLQLEGGEVKIKLRADLAPQHVERIKKLTGEGFYNGVPFHRVIDGFMAQTGDPTGTGTGKSSYPDLPAEFSRENHHRGTVSMARAASPNSANSQFFICFADAPWLDGQYTIWGEVISGMEAVDALPKGRGQSGAVPNPGHIVKAWLAA